MALDRTDLPEEAVKINGQYIEDVISEYMTVITSGREGLPPELTTYTVGTADGELLKSSRFPMREITVEFAVHGSSLENLRTKLILLNKLLNERDAEFIFNDEADKFYRGHAVISEEFKPYKNAASGSYKIYCTDPFKYSVQEYTVTPTADDGSTIVVDYDGTYPAYPKLITEFYQSADADDTNGDCGFVAFANDRGNVIQIGEVEEPDKIAQEVQQLVDETTTTWETSKKLVNEPFNSLSGWSLNNGYTTMDTFVKTGTAQAAAFGTGTDKAARANSYGSTSNAQWHGPSIMKTLGSDGGNPAKNGATDWRFHAILRFAANKTEATAKTERGDLQLFILDAAGKYITGVQMWKKAGGTKGTIRLYVRGAGTIKEWTDISFAHYNARFGYKKNSTDSRPCNIDITKKGSKFTYNIGGLTFSFNYEGHAATVANKISIFFGQWGDAPAISYNGIYSCSFTSDSVTQTKTTETWETLTELLEVQNTFTTNDKLVADCADGSIRLSNSLLTDGQDGGLHPELGRLGNDWERFTLVPGVNQIATMYSDWVQAAYKPSFSLVYRKRYL